MTTWIVTSYYYLGGRLVALKKDTTLRFVHQDHLSGTAVITDSSGAQVGSIKYYPYGETRSTSGTLETDKKFTGQRLDDTGLYYYGARFYDPTIGRFISPDTLVPSPMNPQAFNRYSYCLNNPLRYIDPTGFLTMEQLAASGVHSNDRGMTKELWDLLVAADPGDTIIWTNPEKTSARKYRIISMDQAWQRISTSSFTSAYYNRTELQGERISYWGSINEEGFILHEIGAGKTMKIGELDSSNLRGDMTFTRDAYGPYGVYRNRYYSAYDRAQRGLVEVAKEQYSGVKEAMPQLIGTLEMTGAAIIAVSTIAMTTTAITTSWGWATGPAIGAAIEGLRFAWNSMISGIYHYSEGEIDLREYSTPW